MGARTAQGTATYWARLEPLSPMQICDEVRFCFLGEAAPRSRSTQPNRVRAQVRMGSAHGYGKRAASVPGRSAEGVKIVVKTFLAEKRGCRRLARRGTTPCRVNTLNAWPSLSLSKNVTEGRGAGRSLGSELRVKRAKRHVDGERHEENLQVRRGWGHGNDW